MREVGLKVWQSESELVLLTTTLYCLTKIKEILLSKQNWLHGHVISAVVQHPELRRALYLGFNATVLILII